MRKPVLQHGVVSRKLANTPVEDEEIGEEEKRAAASARERLKHNKPIPFEEVLADCGLTLEDVKNHREPK